MLVQRQESAHVQYVRAKETFPNLALHYEGQEVAFGVAIAMLDGTLRGIASVPEDPMEPRLSGIEQYQAEGR